ncbi:MAG: hypothetical protein AAF399_29160 [Bacteroidota bacterium]
MQLISQILLFLHIAAGFLSLGIFWIPIFTKKGGINHRHLGKLYLIFMWVVVISAALLSVKNVLVGRYQMAAYLGFIALITARPLWYGVAILNQKKGLSPSFQAKHLWFRAAILLASAALISFGIYLEGKNVAVLMFIFGGLGMADLPRFLKDAKQPVTDANWLKQHIVGMCTSGIAAYTAFFVFGANQFLAGLLPGYWAVIPWVAPTIVGTIGIKYTLKKYGLKKKKSTPPINSQLA